MKVTCEVMKDLMPSYVDDICSDDTKELLKEHIQTCSSCKQLLTTMEQPVSNLKLTEDEQDKIKKPFHKIRKRNRIKILISVVLTLAVTIGCMIMIQNVGSIHDIFFPEEIVIINAEEGIHEWKNIAFDQSQYLIYDTIFYKKKITNNANSSGIVTFRILDKEGNIVMDKISMEPGTTKKLNNLENNEKYIVQFLGEAGWYMVNFY